MRTVRNNPDVGGNLAIYVIPNILVNRISGHKMYYSGLYPAVMIDAAAESIINNVKKEGNSYEHTIQCIVYGINDTNTQYFRYLEKYDFIVVLKNHAGKYNRYGNKEIGLRFTFEMDSSGDPTFYKLTFSRRLNSDYSPVSLPMINE